MGHLLGGLTFGLLASLRMMTIYVPLVLIQTSLLLGLGSFLMFHGSLNLVGVHLNPSPLSSWRSPEGGSLLLFLRGGLCSSFPTLFSSHSPDGLLYFPLLRNIRVPRHHPPLLPRLQRSYDIPKRFLRFNWGASLSSDRQAQALRAEVLIAPPHHRRSLHPPLGNALRLQRFNRNSSLSSS